MADVIALVLAWVVFVVVAWFALLFLVAQFLAPAPAEIVLMVGMVCLPFTGPAYLSGRHRLAVWLLRRPTSARTTRALVRWLTASTSADGVALSQARIAAALDRTARARIVPYLRGPVLRGTAGAVARALQLLCAGYRDAAIAMLYDAVYAADGAPPTVAADVAQRTLLALLVADRRWDDCNGLSAEQPHIRRWHSRAARALAAVAHDQGAAASTPHGDTRAPARRMRRGERVLRDAVARFDDAAEPQTPVRDGELLDRVLAAHLDAIGTPPREVLRRFDRIAHAAAGWEALRTNHDALAASATRAAELGVEGLVPVRAVADEALDELADALAQAPDWLWRVRRPPEALAKRVTERVWAEFEGVAAHTAGLDADADPTTLHDAWLTIRRPWLRLCRLLGFAERQSLLHAARSAIVSTACECTIKGRARMFAVHVYAIATREAFVTGADSLWTAYSQNLRIERDRGRSTED